MADQVGSGAMAGVAAEGGQVSPAAEEWSPPQSFHGRPVSWVAVGIIMVAFLIGGVALAAGPVWWLFWVSVGLVAVGGLLALSTHIFDDWY
jgi:hypothetical protein